MIEPSSRRPVRNVIRCNRWGDEIESHHRHDYVRCRCGNAAVDGGLDYARRASGPEGFTDLSEYADMHRWSEPPAPR